MEWGSRRARRSPSALTLGLEAVLLLVFMAWGSREMVNGSIPAAPAVRFYGLTALLPLAMGLQNAALRRVGGKTVRTTYVTGMLTNLAEEIVARLFEKRDGAERQGQPTQSPLALLAGLWNGYVAGALLGSLLESRWALWALALPLAGLAAAITAEWLSAIE
ncbi:MAG: DUF1275 domain-containing protein [Armatimonadota bacterium]|nr:DUF1275 domain-containing protein [Armatimonadota bacterium]